MKFERKKPGGISQDISIPTWKWEELNIDFRVRFPRTRRQYELIWVIVDRMMKSDHFMPAKVYYSAKEYAKLYYREW